MAHSELLQALRLPDEDDGSGSSGNFNFSSTSGSTSPAAHSIPLDEPPTPVSLTHSDVAEPPQERPSILGAEHVTSPSTVATDIMSTNTMDSTPPTARTSISSQISVIPYKRKSTPVDPKDGFEDVSFGDERSNGHADAITDAMASTITPSTKPPATHDEDEPPLSSASDILPPSMNRASSASSTTSSLGKKVSRDQLLLKEEDGPLILGIALIDFNHSVGPRVEMAYPPSLLHDEEMCRILPFLALPDGAHQSAEDYSYFHLTLQDPDTASISSTPTDTVFGISCNRQIAAADLLEKDADVSRSTVQKAVVVLVSKPLFGLIRDRLGVVTNALFNQRDFRDTHILVDFYSGLDASMKSQLTESGLYMGTNLRELIHVFRHRTLTMVKLLILQKKIMFYGHPVERLCTYQYSLVSLIPNLLMGLEDAASPNLDRREKDTSKPTELRTSDRGSLMRYLGLPLNLFGRDAFFQPYLPLQQVDMLKTQSWLCGTTNSIVTSQKDAMPDLLVNIEQNTFEFKDPKLERLVALTPADRKWMDDIVRDVNDGWNEKDPSRPLTMQFKGSDDYLRAKFEDYVCSLLASVKYADWLVKTGRSDLTALGSTGDDNVVQNFGDGWISAFRTCHAYTVWNQITDPSLFDIIEPRHPCESKPTVISDIGLRLAEGLHDLKVTENIAPAREAISNVITVGSTGFFRAFEGVRSEVVARISRQPSSTGSANSGVQVNAPSPSLTPTSIPESTTPSRPVSPSPSSRTSYPPPAPSSAPNGLPVGGTQKGGLRPLSLAPSATAAASAATELGSTAGAAAKATISSWGSFIAKKAGEYRRGSSAPSSPGLEPPAASSPLPTITTTTPRNSGLRSPPLSNLRGALWSLGERGEQAQTQPKEEPSTPPAKPSASSSDKTP